MIKKLLTILLITGCMLFQAAKAEENKLNFNGYVADGAYLFSDVVIENLNRTIQDLHSKTASEIDVVTLKSLNGKEFQYYFQQIEKLKPKELLNTQNRVVLFYAINEDYLQLYLDDWFEDKINTAALQRIGKRDILPYFATGEYDKGLVRGVYLIADEIAKIDDEKVEHYGIMPPSKASFPLFLLWLMLIPVVCGTGAAIWFIREGKVSKSKD